MAAIASGHAALACTFIEPQKPQASFRVTGMWALRLDSSRTAVVMIALSLPMLTKPAREQAW